MIVRRVRAVEPAEDWDNELMLYSLEFDTRAKQVHVCTTERLRVTVEALEVHVEISDAPGGHVRRRVGRFTGVESDKWLDQSRGAARSTRIPL